ncbi:hypothetical protein ABT115_08895 [Streptomyces sp. NPDC001832]|uniref:hypothetical protein n=1 Tax=Streptomyces sp. NPDC001832 TaxID=3154527 RepID=UPI003320042F
MAYVTAAVMRGHLAAKTTQELCDDYEHLVDSKRPMPWAEQAVSDVLFERNQLAWLEWQMEGGLFGFPKPHRYFGLI